MASIVPKYKYIFELNYNVDEVIEEYDFYITQEGIIHSIIITPEIFHSYYTPWSDLESYVDEEGLFF